MKYIVKEITDSVSRLEAIKKAKEVFKENEPYAVVYGFSGRQKTEYFEEPKICKTTEDLKKVTKSILESNPKSTVLVIYKHHMNDSTPKEELAYEKFLIPGPNDDKDDVIYKFPITYILEVERDDIKDALFYIIADERELTKNDEKEIKELENQIDEEYDDLFEKYYDKLLEYFEADAEEKAYLQAY